MFFFYSFQNKIPHCTQKMRIQERKIPGYIRVWYDSNTFSKENKEKPIHFQQKIRRNFTIWMRKTSRNRWKRMERLGFSDCFEIGLDGGKEYL